MPEQNGTAAAFPVSRKKPRIDLDAFDDIAGYAVIGGRDVAVRNMDAIGYAALQAIDARACDHRLPYDIAARVCPDLTRDEIDAISAQKIARILALASGAIKEVEATAPNGSGPTETALQSESPPA